MNPAAGSSLLGAARRFAVSWTAVVALVPAGEAATVRLDGIDLGGVIQEWGGPRAGRSVEGNPLSIGGRTFAHGVGTHARGDWFLDLGGKASRFRAWVGVDDESCGSGSVTFDLYGDGELLWGSGVMVRGDAAKRVDVPLEGVRRLRLNVGDGMNGIGCDHADWAEAAVETSDPAAVRTVEERAGAVYLDELDLSGMAQDYLKPAARLSVEGNPLSIGGGKFDRGIGTHAGSEWWLDLSGKAKRFTAWAGIDDGAEGRGSAVFRVFADRKPAYHSGVMRGGQPAARVEVGLEGVKRICLMVSDAGDGSDFDHADWAEAAVEYAGEGRPAPAKHRDEPPPPIVHPQAAAPRINGPRVIGATPGRPFLFRIPATGAGELEFAAEGMPAGLVLDPRTGVITGSLKRAGTFKVRLEAASESGRAARTLTIIGGEGKLALTPPMGWNSWNVWGCSVDQEKVMLAAKWLVKSGLAAHGYAYVNIDDCWEGERGPDGEIRTNEKFPDLRRVADYCHSLGLKVGIYSSPGPKTCAGYEGSWEHEKQDARTYAKWGIDYLKYDWCSYGNVATGEGREMHVKPYRAMREALDGCGRDIVFSLCQYGMGEVWEWGKSAGGNLWRTAGDISDDWRSLAGIAFRQPELSKWAGPGHWNDPDLLAVGELGWGPDLRPTRLTGNEQILHVTAWALLAAPVLVSCDLSALDEFTLALLANDEVIEVNQDPLGRPVTRTVSDAEMTEVWARRLFDGTLAVGLFNRGFERADVTARWADLGMSGAQPVRDLWAKRDLGKRRDGCTLSVPAHGAALVKIGRPDREEF